MKLRILALASLAIGLVLGASGVAQAQATRTWVSGVGDDANPCSRTAPCKTFAGAISKTAPNGEINVLDPGGFGGVTITKSITIRSDHIEAGVLVSGTNGIVINAAATDNVTLEGLDIEGLGTGLNGVTILGGKKIFILNCKIRHFSGNGVNMTSSSPGAQVFIKDSSIYLNGSGTTSGGVFVKGAGTGNVASILNSFIDNNANFAARADGAGNIIAVANSVLADSPADISLLNGATAVSFGPSSVLPDATSAATPVPFK